MAEPDLQIRVADDTSAARGSDQPLKMTKMVAIPTVAAQPRLAGFVHYCNTAVARRKVMEVRIHQTGSIDLLVRSR